MLNKQILIFVFLVAVILLVQSCKRGCSDRTAINYSPSAKVNDGTCAYCDSSFVSADSAGVFIEDENPQSQFAFQDVLEVRVTSVVQQLTGNGCRLLGYNVQSTGGCTNFSNYVQLINRTSKKITFTGQVMIEYEGGGLQQINYTFNSTVVPPSGSTNLGNAGNICEEDNFPFIELFNTGISSIQYN